MAARVTTSEVQAVYDGYSTLSDYDTFIAIANLVVDEDLGSSGLSASRLKEIERYLAAHFAALSKEKGGLRRKRVGEASEEYNIPSFRELGYLSTRYGQQAVTLDTTGTLGANSKSANKAQFRVVSGTRADEASRLWRALWT